MYDFKAIFFDLDGTIISSTKELHYQALNLALEELAPDCVITRTEHERIYDALSTRQKLELLTKTKGLDAQLHNAISDLKQRITHLMISQAEFQGVPRDRMVRLKSTYKLALCTNTISSTTAILLAKLDLTDVFDLILTNEDVESKKPHPEIYQKAARYFGFLPEECLVIEDSEHGVTSGIRTGCSVYTVKDYLDTIILIEDL